MTQLLVPELFPFVYKKKKQLKPRNILNKLLDIGKQAIQEINHWEKGNQQGKSYGHPEFLPGGNFRDMGVMSQKSYWV